MGLQGLKGPAVAVPGGGEDGRLHVPALDAAVEGTEAVDEGLQLGGHPVVVQGRHKHHHVRVQDLCSDDLHVVLLDAGTLISAVDAPGTGVDLAVGGVNDLHRVAGLLGAPDKRAGQQVGGAVLVGAAL